MGRARGPTSHQPFVTPAHRQGPQSDPQLNAPVAVRGDPADGSNHKDDHQPGSGYAAATRRHLPWTGGCRARPVSIKDSTATGVLKTSTRHPPPSRWQDSRPCQSPVFIKDSPAPERARRSTKHQRPRQCVACPLGAGPPLLVTVTLGRGFLWRQSPGTVETPLRWFLPLANR
jgi:hypothetical protein